MKIIHTSDWHLGHRLYNYDRTDEELHFFSQLSKVVEAERPDALLVSGDVFHTGVPGNDVAKRFTEQLMSVQESCPTMEVILVAGNHDSYSRLEIDQALWARRHVHIVGTPAENDDGTADFARNIIAIGDKGLVAAVPFCHARNFPLVRGEESDRLKAYFMGLRKAAAAKNVRGLPTVLMAHLAVGSDADISGQDVSDVDGDGGRIELAAFGTGYDYIALGHIHFAQWIKGERKLARYCGTPRQIHFDERHLHGVDVVEVETGMEPKLRTIPLKPLRSLKTIGGAKGLAFAAALEEFNAEEIPEGSYVRLNVRLGKDEPVGVDWTEMARKVAETRNLRFCLINPIREQVGEDGNAAAGGMLTMDQIRELSDDDVLTVLHERHSLSERQRELLKGLLMTLNEANRVEER